MWNIVRVNDFLYIFFRSNHQRWCSVRKGVLRNFEKFTGKHASACDFIKEEILAQVFSCEFCEVFLQNTFFTEHLRATASSFWIIFTQHEKTPVAPGVMSEKDSICKWEFLKKSFLSMSISYETFRKLF